MKALFAYIKNKVTLLIAIMLAAVVGGATTAVVMASIPDSLGVIHVCRASDTGLVRMIDTASQSCTGAETEVTWDQEGVQAYGRILANGTLDSTNSKNIIASEMANDSNFYCVEVVGSPKNVTVSNESSSNPQILIKGISGEDTYFSQNCDSNYNIMAGISSGSGAIYIAVNQ